MSLPAPINAFPCSVSLSFPLESSPCLPLEALWSSCLVLGSPIPLHSPHQIFASLFPWLSASLRKLHGGWNSGSSFLVLNVPDPVAGLQKANMCCRPDTLRDAARRGEWGKKMMVGMSFPLTGILAIPPGLSRAKGETT